jgi:hypothetical protein
MRGHLGKDDNAISRAPAVVTGERLGEGKNGTIRRWAEYRANPIVSAGAAEKTPALLDLKSLESRAES